MDLDCQMFLVIREDRHRLKEGITLIGSEDNDRYSCIRLQDKSICPKHAAFRCFPATQEIHIMDLCSHGGVLLTGDNNQTQKLPALEWRKASNSNKIRIGSIECRLEASKGVRKSNRSSVSFFADEDSTDFIDCSLEDLQEDPYLATTQALIIEPNLAAHASTSAYELATQLPPALASIESPAFKVPSVPAYDMLTQKMPSEDIKRARPLRKLAIKLTDLKANNTDVSMRKNKQIQLDPFEVATQPLRDGEDEDIYDLQTQPLPKDMFKEVLDDTVPLDLPVPSPPVPDDDIYDLQTQVLVAKSSSGSLEDEDPEMSKNFQPKVNSTCRQSVLVKQIVDQEQQEVQNAGKDDQLNISPSSNKENRVEVIQRSKDNSSTGSKSSLLGLSKLVDEGLDDEYCLAATLPVSDESSKSKKANTKAGKDACKKGKSSSEFRAPDNRSTASSTKSSITSLETPRSKASSTATGGADTCSFDFNTPDHPFLNVAKKETILAVSDMILKRSKPAAKQHKNKYLFGDSSDEDNDPTEPVFRKMDSKIQVMKYDKDEDSSAKSTISEKRSSRERKKIRRYSDGEEDSKSIASTRSRGKLDRKKETSTNNPGKLKVDESVDYQPSNGEIKSSRTRKRKAAEEQQPSSDSEQSTLAPKASKSKKNNEAQRQLSSEIEQSTVAQKASKSKKNNEVQRQLPSESGQSALTSKASTSKKDSEANKQLSTDSEQSTVVQKASKSKKHKDADNESKAGSSKSESSTSDRVGRPKRAVTVEVTKSELSKPVDKTSEVAPAVNAAKKADLRSNRRQPKQSSKAASTHLSSDDDQQTTSSAANTSTASGSESSETRKSTRASKPRLMFTKMSPEPYKRMITRAGGTIVDMPELASILISDRIYRTYKFLCAIAKGIAIVGQPFLEAVEINQNFVDPWDYILEDKEMERRFKFNLKKSLTLAREAKIFQDYSMFVTPNTKPPPEELQLIMASAGGRAIKFPSQHPKQTDKVFVVSDLQDRDMWPKIRERYPDIDIISTEGFMLSVMQHYKHFRSYRLT